MINYSLYFFAFLDGRSVEWDDGSVAGDCYCSIMHVNGSNFLNNIPNIILITLIKSKTVISQSASLLSTRTNSLTCLYTFS